MLPVPETSAELPWAAGTVVEVVPVPGAVELTEADGVEDDEGGLEGGGLPADWLVAGVVAAAPVDDPVP